MARVKTEFVAVKSVYLDDVVKKLNDLSDKWDNVDVETPIIHDKEGRFCVITKCTDRLK